MDVLDVAGPADDQLLAGGFEGADATDHGIVSGTNGEGPLGGCGGVVSFRQRGGSIFGLDGKVTNCSRFGRRGVRGAWEVPLWRAAGEGRYDGKIVAYMKDTTREFDALGSEIGLLLEDLFADVLERDLGRRLVLREAIHGGGEGRAME
jgi:hypothetical protein